MSKATKDGYKFIKFEFVTLNNEDTSSSDESEVSKSSNNSNKEDILIEEITFLQRGVKELERELDERKKNEAKHVKYHYDEWLNEFFEVKNIIKNGNGIIASIMCS